MADMPAYHPPVYESGDLINETGDDAFADELSGNLYPATRARHAAGPPRGLYGVAQKQLYGMAEGGKAELLRNVGGLVTMVREIASQIEGFGVEPFAGYARQASGVVGEIHDSLAEKSIDDLIEDGREFVRERPEIVIGAAVVAGFVVARLLKAR